MSVDSQKIHDICTNIHELWASPISIIVALYLLWQVIGPSSLAGLAVLLIAGPLNAGGSARLFIKYQVKHRHWIEPLTPPPYRNALEIHLEEIHPQTAIV